MSLSYSSLLRHGPVKRLRVLRWLSVLLQVWCIVCLVDMHKRFVNIVKLALLRIRQHTHTMIQYTVDTVVVH